MFEYLSGILSRRTPTELILECGGVGYRLLISLQTSEAIAQAESEGQLTRTENGPQLRLWVHPHYTETDQKLFGFWTERERELFRLLQAVKGVGPTLARAILSHEPPERLIERMRSGDATALTRIKGIGRKTAERMLVELKDRLPPPTTDPTAAAQSQIHDALLKTLATLGMAPAEAQQAADRALEELPESNRLEDYLRIALRQRGRATGGAR